MELYSEEKRRQQSLAANRITVASCFLTRNNIGEALCRKGVSRLASNWAYVSLSFFLLPGRDMLFEEGGGKGGRPRGHLPSVNVLGGPLEICSIRPMTGFFRNGCCDTSSDDFGSHTVCVVMTEEFLAFSKSRGNDLSTPNPAFGFAGLQPGDRWCLCAPRWQEALQAGQAPRVVLRATHKGALSYCALADLKRYAIDLA